MKRKIKSILVIVFVVTILIVLFFIFGSSFLVQKIPLEGPVLTPEIERAFSTPSK